MAQAVFDAGTALENLRAEVVDMEALARAAEVAAETLPMPAIDLQRMVYGRIQSLATKAEQPSLAPLRERADRRAHRANQGTAEGGRPLRVAAHTTAR